MFTEKLKLVGYGRITQNLIHSIELDFTKVIQIIIGSNGSGKSSIKEQLSPLPPQSSDFIKGGRKEWHGRRNGHHYIAISDFGEKGGHYFEKDGEILNNWGTALVQKSLIQREFHLTQEIFDVLVGSKKFTDMSPTDRRDWVMFLSNIDINPLMALFAEAKTKQRDAKGYLAKVSERLKLEAKNKIDEDTIAEKVEQLKLLKDEFNYYSQFSAEIHGSPDRTDLSDRTAHLLDFMDAIFNNIPKVPSSILKYGVRDLEGLKNFIVSNQAKLGTLREQHSKFMNELKEINKVAQAKALLSTQGIEEIQARIASIEGSIADLDKKLAEYPYTVEAPKQAKLDFLRVSLDLRSALFDLPPNSDLKFNSNALNEARAREEGMLHRLHRTNEAIYKKEHQVKHIDESAEIICPECTFSFKHGVGKNDRSDLVNEISNLNLERVRLEDAIKEDKEYIVECMAFMDKIRDIYNTMNLTPSNMGLWTLIKAEEFYKNPVFRCIELLDQHNDFLDLAIKKEDFIDLLNKENDILIKAQESLNLINESSSDSVSKIDEDIFNIAQEIDKLTYITQLAENAYNRLKHSLTQIGQLREYFDDFNMVYFKQLDEMRANFIRDTKFNIMKEINFIEQELEAARVKNAIFKDVENELELAKKTHAEYTHIVNNLSPNTGLIADLMNESINGFVNTLNALIGSVWTSDLLVLPCVNKKNDLDWKFPVLVDNDQQRSDVSKTSTSQGDIINFAFQRAIANHIGAAEYPMYVDELGSSMDDQHRINTMHILSDLVETKQCSQMFMISHFAAFHEQFTNNETLVLDAKNIINMPRTYNQHVKINEVESV